MRGFLFSSGSIYLSSWLPEHVDEVRGVGDRRPQGVQLPLLPAAHGVRRGVGTLHPLKSLRRIPSF